MTDDLDRRLQRLLSQNAPSGTDVPALDRVLRSATRHAFALQAAPRGSRVLSAVAMATVVGGAAVLGAVTLHNHSTGPPTTGTTPPGPSASPLSSPSPPFPSPSATVIPSPSATPAPPFPVVTRPSIVSATFTDVRRGFGAGMTGVVRTDDGGLVWYRVTPPGLTLDATSRVTLASGARDQLVVDVWDPAGTPAGIIYATADGGLTWHHTQLAQGAGQMQMIDEHTGYLLVGLGGAAGSQRAAVLRTTDGGLSWATVSETAPTTSGAPGGPGLPFSCTKTGIGFRDAAKGWVTGNCTGGGTVFLTTSDGGVHWASATSTLQVPRDDGFLDTSPPTFATAQDGSFIARGRDGTGTMVLLVVTTHDAGATWQSASTPAGTIAAQALPRLGVTWSLSSDGTLTVARQGAAPHASHHTELATSVAELQGFDSTQGYILVNPGSTDGTQATVLYSTPDGGATIVRRAG